MVDNGNLLWYSCGSFWCFFIKHRELFLCFGGKMKKVFYSELAYLAGLLILALGTALMEKADMGMSMVVAPAYLVHLVLSQTFPWFTFGVAEYTFQAVLLFVMIAVLRRFRVGYLFSFVTAVVYGLMLDAVMLPVAGLPVALTFRVIYYVVGLLLCSLGVALLLHTYIAPEVYELFVKEWAARFGQPIGKVKTAYDCISCTAAVVMSFLFFGFGHFEGVKYGTILCALINGWIIGKITAWLDHRFIFRDMLRK